MTTTTTQMEAPNTLWAIREDPSHRYPLCSAQIARPDLPVMANNYPTTLRLCTIPCTHQWRAPQSTRTPWTSQMALLLRYVNFFLSLNNAEKCFIFLTKYYVAYISDCYKVSATFYLIGTFLCNNIKQRHVQSFGKLTFFLIIIFLLVIKLCIMIGGCQLVAFALCVGILPIGGLCSTRIRVKAFS